MNLENVNIIKVTSTGSQKLLEIGYQTFYDSFGPPINSEENIQSYLREKFTIEQITNELNNPDSEFYFAKIDNEIVGYMKLNSEGAQTESVEGKSTEIERIYVVKEHQGKKIGQFLFKKAIEIAKESSSEYLWLGVWDQNPRAIQFYKRNGLKIFYKHRFMLGTEIQTDVMMKIVL